MKTVVNLSTSSQLRLQINQAKFCDFIFDEHSKVNPGIIHLVIASDVLMSPAGANKLINEKVHTSHSDFVLTMSRKLASSSRPSGSRFAFITDICDFRGRSDDAIADYKTIAA